MELFAMFCLITPYITKSYLYHILQNIIIKKEKEQEKVFTDVLSIGIARSTLNHNNLPKGQIIISANSAYDLEETRSFSKNE